MPPPGRRVRPTVTCEIPPSYRQVTQAPVSPAETISLSDPPSSERFVDGGEIARGGMGEVRLAFDRVLRRDVAMKISDPSKPNYTQAALRFMEEAQITGQLDHPNIVPVHDFGSGLDRGGVFFTMKLVKGETLTEFVDRLAGAPLSPRALDGFLDVFIKVCDAISFAHSRGVVHRDLKPDNVMVGGFGQVYVMDWGVAVLLEGNRPSQHIEGPRVSLSEDLSRHGAEETGAIVGTFDYMAPEQAWGRTDQIDERTDVYGLGGILYHLLTGAGPHAAPTAFEALQSAQRGRVEPPETRGAWPDLPPGLCDIAMKALAKEPTDRYQSVEALKADVQEFRRGGGWFKTRRYASDDIIVRQGDPGDSAYIIIEGECEVSKMVDGEARVLRRMGPGDVFGETAVLTGEPRTATVVATGDVVVKVVTREALEQELGRQSWSGAFVKALAERFREVDERLSRISR